MKYIKKNSKLEQYLSIDEEDLEIMDKSELKKTNQYIARYANARLKKIKEDKTNPALDQLDEIIIEKGFTTRNHSETALRNQYIELRSFMQSRISKASEWNKIKEEMGGYLAGLAKEVNVKSGAEVEKFVNNMLLYENQKKFWKAYHDLDEEGGKHFKERNASDFVLTQYFRKVVSSKGLTVTADDKLKEIIDSISQKQIEAQQVREQSVFSSSLNILKNSGNEDTANVWRKNK